ncbi:hypothetical protein [Microbacterium nymphoidis]|uniref:hypothetical protein n=1 Tax=Microbacterium nymphoidis TaxID=2898586 RepID=UPI001E64420E|nr:hypothetical protein [Microbacterium nymphoidis]MCD2497136.1 hypothetical protein [Microbacterium nymphoidis]
MIDDPRFAADSAPRLVPDSYPGVWPESSVLVTAEGLWELRDRDGVALQAGQTSPTRLGLCRVAVDEETRARVTDGARSAPQLSRVLEGFHVVGMDSRVPVLAIGSNAAPSQLRHKFREIPDALVLPSVRARVQGVALAYAGFFAGYGALPATIVPSNAGSSNAVPSNAIPSNAVSSVSSGAVSSNAVSSVSSGAVSSNVGSSNGVSSNGVSSSAAELELHVQFTDPGQLAGLDRTEAPHYRRVWLDASSGVRVVLETGEELPGVYAYVARGGALCDETGAVIPAAMRPTDAGLSQIAVVERLAAVSALAEAWGSDATALRARAGALADGGAAVLADAGLLAPPSPFTRLADESGTPSTRTYGGMLPPASNIPAAQPGSVTLVTTVTPAGIERGGKSVVSISRRVHESLGGPDVVELRSHALMAGHGAAAPSALAAVVIREESPDAAPDHVVEVDHVLRMACGLENGEIADLRPVRLERGTAGDRVVGKPTYLTMRTTLADPASAERDVVLMSRLALDILGVGPGDYVVVEGAGTGAGDAPAGEIPTVMLKAFEAPGSVEDTRQRITGGTWGARFPAAEETLGVRPDLPLAFLDLELRTRLGIAGQTLATVRVRPARLPQFWSELREMLLILAVAFLGVVVVAPWPWLQMLLIVALVVMSLWLIVQRLRRRLTHVLRRGQRRGR